MRRQNLGLVLLAAALAGVGGCTGLEVLPVAAIAAKGVSKTVDASRPISDSEEYYVGRAVAARLLATYPLY